MARIGYARVSREDQHPEVQEERLIAAGGCDRVFTDHGVSGSLASRPEWDKARAYLRPGDALVVVKLDRMGRSLKNLIETLESFRELGVDLVVLDQGIDTTTAMGRLFFNILGSFAEFEKELIRERTRDGLKSAREKGHKSGRKPRLSPARAALVRTLFREQHMSVTDIAAELLRSEGVVIGRSALYAYLQEPERAGRLDEGRTNHYEPAAS